ncbi:methyltransferase [Limnothrix redekei]|uniref:Methyltransferase n=1 Tax=Limnothrix redekei LRLZ20PSL1 TaxID=3112953 RepID=A0ABW7CAQ6_9CYAN
MNQPNKYSALTQNYLIKNMSLEKVYTFKYQNKYFLGLNTVFSPLVFEDTYFFAEHVPYKPGSHFLEIGAGTGLISIIQALHGVNVTATDINPDAVLNIKMNAILHSVEEHIQVIHSDLFDSIEKSHTFDSIFWNPPFILSHETPQSFLEKSTFDFQYSSIEKFMSSFSKYLKPDGHAYIGFSSTSGDILYLQDLCFRQNLSLRLVVKGELSENIYDELFTVELYEILPAKKELNKPEF